ncbi:hypothetical protein [Jiella pacifica]|uniref:DUF1878 family protein n=1 Tax=Jiella pacifica TaxID=2696469 RepID=A0A6N9T6V9_9HYPH|nr:hypothetical protein [Jiella pacifica]NDW05806.1 hypothetical protein [Jiella pacifica]
MNNHEIEDAIRKLRYQIKILGEAIDFRQKPIESLILEMDWDEGDISKVHDVFEKWDNALHKKVKLTSGAFENDFKALNIDYQTLKSVILAFYRNGQWMEVCKAYVDSFNGSPPLEYHRIMRGEMD